MKEPLTNFYAFLIIFYELEVSEVIPWMNIYNMLIVIYMQTFRTFG